MVVTDENRLVMRSQQGDHGAFEQLIREHQRMIHSLCYRMTGSLEDSDDLAQESFIQAYRHLGSYRAEARFSSWIYRIAMNQCLNWQKRRASRERLQKLWAENAAPEGHRAEERSDQVQAALMRLNPKQRAAVVLTIYDGFSHAEAAKALGCSETTVSWRIFAARVRLKRILKKTMGAQNE